MTKEELNAREFAVSEGWPNQPELYSEMWTTMQAYADKCVEKERERIVAELEQSVVDDVYVHQSPEQYHPGDVRQARITVETTVKAIKIVKQEQ